MIEVRAASTVLTMAIGTVFGTVVWTALRTVASPVRRPSGGCWSLPWRARRQRGPVVTALG